MHYVTQTGYVTLIFLPLLLEMKGLHYHALTPNFSFYLGSVRRCPVLREG